MTWTARCQSTAVSPPQRRSLCNVRMPCGHLLVVLLFILSTVATLQPITAAELRTSSDEFSGLFDVGKRAHALSGVPRHGKSRQSSLKLAPGTTARPGTPLGLPAGIAQTAVLPGVACLYPRLCLRPSRERSSTSSSHSRSDPVADAAHRERHRRGSAYVAHRRRLFPDRMCWPGIHLAAWSSASTPPPTRMSVAGLVLIDAAHEDYYAAQQAALTPEQQAETGDSSRRRVRRNWPVTRTSSALIPSASAVQMRQAVSATPLAAHARDRAHPWSPLGLASRLLRQPSWKRSGCRCRSNSLRAAPDSRLIVADQSGHFIPGDQPDASDRRRSAQVVEAVRDPDSTSTDWPG